MKVKFLSLVSMFLIGTMTVFAGTKTETFKVLGNCGMCESRIEKAVLSVDGVSKADWDEKTKMIEIVFDDSKTDVHKIQKAIADAGHDTDMIKAKVEVYNNLPGCCKYERGGSEMEMNGQENHNNHEGHEGMDHSKCTNSKKSTHKSSCGGMN